MRRYWKIGLAVALLISLVLVAISKEISPPFVEMEVKGVRLEKRPSPSGSACWRPMRSIRS
jgi:hypothetical protein